MSLRLPAHMSGMQEISGGPVSPREIDALVAGHIFGWKWVVNVDHNFTHLTDWAKDVSGCRFLRDSTFRPHELQAFATGSEPIGRTVVGGYTEIYPRYSTDPAASKQLRDKMRADGWRFTMYDQKDSMVFAQFIRNDDHGFLTPCESADTEEMAVALAALAAVGKPVAR